MYADSYTVEAWDNDGNARDIDGAAWVDVASMLDSCALDSEVEL